MLAILAISAILAILNVLGQRLGPSYGVLRPLGAVRRTYPRHVLQLPKTDLSCLPNEVFGEAGSAHGFAQQSRQAVVLPKTFLPKSFERGRTNRYKQSAWTRLTQHGACIRRRHMKQSVLLKMILLSRCAYMAIFTRLHSFTSKTLSHLKQ